MVVALHVHIHMVTGQGYTYNMLVDLITLLAALH